MMRRNVIAFIDSASKISHELRHAVENPKTRKA